MKNKLLVIAVFLFILVLITPACKTTPDNTTEITSVTTTTTTTTPTTNYTPITPSTTISTPTTSAVLTTRTSTGTLTVGGDDSMNLVYADDFSNTASGWSVSSDADLVTSYNNGEFCFSIHKQGLIYNTGTNAFGAQSNFVVSVDARTNATGSDAGYGLEFRRDENNGFYYFVIKNNQYSLQKLINNKWETLQAYTKSDYIKTDGSANQLKVACLGKTIEVYVNGQKLTTVADTSLAAGTIYLAATGTGADIFFDNFQLYHFTNAYIISTDPTIPVITTAGLADGETGINYNRTLAVTGGTSPYVWSIIDGSLPDGLSLSASSGSITGTPDTEGKYAFTVQVTAKSGVTTLPLSITVTSLTIATEHLTDGNLNSAYNFTLAVSGGASPYTWSLDSGSLPDGLKLNAATGAITGTPTKSGGPVTDYFKITDSAGAVKTKGLSITIGPGDFQKIDAWAVNAPASVTTSIQTLVTYLLQPCQNETEKARVIYRWITKNISYDEATGKKIEDGITTGLPDQGAEAVFSRRNGVCAGYSYLFKQMCDYASLQSAYITGWGKVDYAYIADTAYNKQNHAWNAVQINGAWRLIESTWGAGDVDSATLDFWFLTPPEKFVYTHCPDDAKWQLLPSPVSSSAIAQHPVVKPGFFEYGLQIGENDYPSYNIKNSLVLTIPVPPDVILSAGVFQNDVALTGNYTFCQRKDNANYEVNARFPTAGNYDLKIYAKWQSASGDYPLAVVYLIAASQNPDNSSQFPKEYSLFSEKGAYLYSFVPGIVQSGTSYNYKISVPGAVEVVFITNLDSSSPVFHKLIKTGQIFEGRIDIVKGAMHISAKFPGDDSYWALFEYTGQ